MDPFTEKDLIECLKSIAVSLRNMDRKMDEMIMAIREVGLCLEESEGDSLAEEEPEAKVE